MDDKISNIRSLITNGEPEKALELAEEIYDDQKKILIINLQSQFASLKKNEHEGIVSYHDSFLIRNRIVKSFLELLQIDLTNDGFHLSRSELISIYNACKELVSGIREIDNEFTKIISYLLRFRLSWDSDKRENIIFEMEQFVRKEEILPRVLQSFPILEHYANKEFSLTEFGNSINKIYRNAKIIIEDILREEGTPIGSLKSLNDFLEWIETAKSDEDEKRIRDMASYMMNRIDKQVLREMDSELGAIKRIIEVNLPETI